MFEKTIYTRIYSYLVKNNRIFDKQFGFRNNYSTDHALVSITERIKDLLDSGKFVCGVFVDLEKAFATVNHKILCEKCTERQRERFNQILPCKQETICFN